MRRSGGGGVGDSRDGDEGQGNQRAARDNRVPRKLGGKLSRWDSRCVDGDERREHGQREMHGGDAWLKDTAPERLGTAGQIRAWRILR